MTFWWKSFVTACSLQNQRLLLSAVSLSNVVETECFEQLSVAVTYLVLFVKKI